MNPLSESLICENFRKTFFFPVQASEKPPLTCAERGGFGGGY